MHTAIQYFKDNKERFVEEWMNLLRIPSISADSQFSSDVRDAAVFVQQALADAGVDNVEIHETLGHPVVFAQKIVDPNLPTVLVYGHYDVQPPDPIELWRKPPFEPYIEDGKVYARGACDDKGQMYMHIKAFESMIKTNNLPCNVKFLIEGEEEVGSDHLGAYVYTHLKELSCDVILISDTSMISLDVPSITTGIRGLSYVEVEVTGPSRDLHSGIYGGAVANPINMLCKMIADMHDDAGRITIPGFYDDVLAVSADERQAMNQAPFDLINYKKDLDIADVKGEEGYTTLERTSIRPTLDVNGIWGGYIGEGAKTVLPAKAFAKISMRLVPNQAPETITKLFQEYFQSKAPASVKVEVRPHHGGEPVVTPTASDEYSAAAQAYLHTFGVQPIPQRSGGSIPIVALFQKALKVNTVLMGFGLDTDAIHSPNEHFGLDNFYKGIETIPWFYYYYTAIKK